MLSKGTHSYVLRYFDAVGYGESIRLLLTSANVEWSEVHPEWPQEKSNQPFGRLPVLIEKSADGSPDLVISEPGNIERYIARTYGLVPSDLRAAALQEQMRDQLSDAHTALIRYFFAINEKDKDMRMAVFLKLFDEVIVIQSKLLRENGNTGRLFGTLNSYADIVSYGFYKDLLIGMGRYDEYIVDIVKSKLTPEIANLIYTVEADPRLEKYMLKAGSLLATINA
ncbi:hypothetical protein COEREDRAFT_9808 [Coemansia reversa NRRL 1564]|uniref:GST N-terminal domain-containing protein n=1 Tax=Coemansia reversa (strain ATCC 12441 / NRRL 1564) TaxID=763665 RepID=A0A2G5B7B7_COERN|nr:hypothetical protein COEREDRAFT_9808 [Coemansia reversa NRRL 1564]|eukprot:PIA14943.1 hypothetical protein COEREDRAFT_9808 [Coemansia reversa NRRL 1564]